MSTLTPIPGNDVQVGDVLVANPAGRRMTVERFTLTTRVGDWNRPLLTAHGVTEMEPGPHTPEGYVSRTWTEDFYGDAWVVVER